MNFKDWHASIVVVLVLRSVCNFLWDVRMDWALGHVRFGRLPLLRPM